MNLYDETSKFIDYSISNKNRKRIISSVEIGFGLFMIILGISTAMCEIEYVDVNKEKNDEQYIE